MLEKILLSLILLPYHRLIFIFYFRRNLSVGKIGRKRKTRHGTAVVLHRELSWRRYQGEKVK